MTIHEAIRKLAKQDYANSIIGTVKSIDSSTKTCTISPVDDQPDIIEVRLSAIENPNTGIIPIPAIDSIVIVGQTENDQPHILLFSEIDDYQIIANNEIKLNDGSFGGLVKINELVDKLNAIEDKVNELIDDYKLHNHLHPIAPTTGLVVPYIGLTLSNTTVNQLENNKILHGE